MRHMSLLLLLRILFKVKSGKKHAPIMCLLQQTCLPASLLSLNMQDQLPAAEAASEW